MALDPKSLAAKLNAARLEKSRRAVSVRAEKGEALKHLSANEPTKSAPLEWWQREKRPQRGPLDGPKPASAAQWRRLALCLWSGDPAREPTRATVRAFVRFANAYDYPTFYTSIHLSIALDLALRGVNIYGTAEEIVSFSEGVDLPEPNKQNHSITWRKRGPKKNGARKHSAP